jgi:thiamine-monophosphate kinase
MTGELEVIRRIKTAAKTRNAAVRVGIGDDCAVIRQLAGQELVVTTDFCLEGRHFRRDWHTAESAGHRCLARGLSDVAAMGARPVTAFLSLALPRDLDEAWLAGFMAGFEALASEYGVELAGGDTGESPGEQVLADVMVIGSAVKMRAMRRKGARVGDQIYVSGRLGGSAAELAAMASGTPWEQAVQPQSFPVPRVALGQALAKRPWATACLDVSDGISTDLRHLAEASKLRAELDLALVPVAEGATLKQALHGGEDYELLFTVMAGVKLPRSIYGIELTRIGTMRAGEGVGVAGGGELERGGWEHLSGQ